MDVATITDIQQLKALAYDEALRLEQAQRNLQILQARIASLTPAKEGAGKITGMETNG